MKKRARILIIEDEKEMTRALQRALTHQGYEAISARDGESALEMIGQQPLDVILLDLGLPGMSGLEVCKRVRAQSHLPPIIVLSVRSKENEKVRALDLGADDYVAKPFGINEVLARIRVALRHATATLMPVESSLTIGPLTVDVAQKLVQLHGQEIQLTSTEYNLLGVLLKHRGKILTQQMLLQQIWKSDQVKQANYLHVYISHLRRKIEPDPTHPRFLHTISGVGYRFQDDEQEDGGSDEHMQDYSTDALL